MRSYLERGKHLLIISLFLLLTWSVFQFVFDFVRITDMLSAYKVLWCAIFLAVMLKLYIFAYITVISSCIGLTVEFIVSVSYRQRFGHPTAASATANLVLVVIGILVGIVIQVIYKRRIKCRE